MRNISDKKRIVIKLGTSTLAHKTGKLNIRRMTNLVRVISDLHNSGREIIMVSSGAVGLGAGKLGLPEKPKDTKTKQAVAAIGQCELMHVYDDMFAKYSVTVAQILLTGDDVDDPERAAHLKATFTALLEMGVIPVVNENDSVSAAEIETGQHKILGDNDTLSAIVAKLCDADLLVLFSDIDGLYDADPRTNKSARLLSRIEALTDDILSMAGGAGSWRGTGGMATKLNAAHIAMNASCDMVITNGSKPENLYEIVEGKPVGTLFTAKRD